MPPQRPITVTPLAGNPLFLRSMSGDEVMGGLFEYQVQVSSPNGEIKLSDALGSSLTIVVPLAAGGDRHFNGIITRFTRIGQVGRSILYRATVHPWLWLLSRNADCRIFQGRTVPEIVKKIFRKYQVNLFEEVLGDSAPREYLVQYRETDLNFVCRLLEDEGIAFHFDHALGQHTLVLTDSRRRREARKGYETVPLRSASSAGQDECLIAWNVSQEVQPASYMLKDFDYQKPLAPLAAASTAQASADFKVQGEFYDYPGKYLVTDSNDHSQVVGSKVVAVRLEQVETPYETVEASGPVRGIGAGNVFGLDGPLSLGGGREYLIIRAHYEIQGQIPESANAGAAQDESFTCAITGVDAKVSYRPPRLTPTPIVQGPQTATVVGPKKEDPGKDEIWTDELGRVLVKFHWERLGGLKPKDPERADDDADNDKAPCWLRVAQLWAGSGFGTVFIPRIGQEVMVEFLEGDPDRPIVTGRLYNNDNKPAYLGEQKFTQSGIRTRSSPEGGPKNFNEIRFEDKKGAEELYIQAEKNQNTHVKANRSASVGGGDSISVGGDRSITINGNLSIKVAGGGKSAVQSLLDVTGEHDITASKKIKLSVGSTFIEITEDTITLHAKDGGEIILKGDIEAHSVDKSALHLDANAKLSTPGAATVTGKTLLGAGTDTATIQSKATTVHADNTATVDGKDVKVTGGMTVAIAGSHSTVDVNGSGVAASGPEIKLNG